MNGPQIEEEEFEIVSDGPVSDTLIGLLYGGTVRPGPAPVHSATTGESAAVPAIAEGKSRYKSRYKPRPKRNRKQSTAIARTAQPSPEPESPLERHQRKCVVCSHPDREIIEELFLHWHSPNGIAYDYKFPASSLYRHGHATGLYTQRQGNLRFVLDRILERVGGATVTGDTIIRAVRAYTCLTPENTWVEPASRVIFSTAPAPVPASAPRELALSETEGAASAPVANGRARQKLLETSAQMDASAIALAKADQFLIDTPAIRK